MRRIVFLFVFLTGALPARAQAQTAADSAAIRQAALDYIEGWYGGDAGRMERAVHPELVKRIVRTTPAGRSVISGMGASVLVEQTRGGGGKDATAKRTDVRILDIFGNAAAVRVDAGEWVDYLQLGRTDGQWRIINVLWEMRPRG